MADRGFGLADRIDELGQAPQAAWEAARAAGQTDAPAPLALSEDPAPIVDVDQDPDAALHSAKPGKLKPAAAAAPQLPRIQDTGTLADTAEQMPELRPVRATAKPLEDVPTFGETFEAARRMMRSDRSDFDEIRIRDGYSPIVKALGLRDSENPASFYMRDPSSIGGAAMMDSHPSDLATAAKQGANTFGSTYFATRDLQERLIADQIRQRRAKDPAFLKGVPDTVDGLHAYFIEQEKAQRQGAAGVIARSSGLSATLAQLAGGGVESFHDPINIVTLPLGGGGKTIVQIAAREALTQGVLELAQQPFVAANRQELGEQLTAGEALGNVGTAALGGAVLGVGFHALGKGISATGAPAAAAKLTGAMTAKINEAVTALAGRGMRIEINPKLPIDQALAELDNRQLIALHRQMAGEDNLTPEETAAGNVLERSTEVAETSPYQRWPRRRRHARGRPRRGDQGYRGVTRHPRP
jgi:hypothetical protein